MFDYVRLEYANRKKYMISWMKTVPILMITGIFFPQEALACGCCDGYKERDPLAWDKDKKHLYVVRDTTLSCEKLRITEVWEIGKNVVQECITRANVGNKLYTRVPCTDDGFLKI